MRQSVLAILIGGCLVGCQVLGTGSPGDTGSAATPVATPTQTAPSTKASQRPLPSGPRQLDLVVQAMGPDGRLYATDCARSAVVSIGMDGVAKLLVRGDVIRPPESDGLYYGDGGPALLAQIGCPSGIAFDGVGRILIADHGHNRIRRVGANGIIETIVGDGTKPSLGGAFGGDGGPAVGGLLNTPVNIAFDRSGNLYIADRENDRVRMVSAEGIITTIAGSGASKFGGDDGPAIDAGLDFPLGLAADAAGNLYIADDNHNRIRKVTRDGTISTLIGDSLRESDGDGGRGADASVNDPQGVVLDDVGNIYITEYGGNRIRRIDAKGIVSTLPIDNRSAVVDGPTTLVLGLDGALYYSNSMLQIVRFDLRRFLETGLSTTTVIANGSSILALP